MTTKTDDMPTFDVSDDTDMLDQPTGAAVAWGCGALLFCALFFLIIFLVVIM